MKIFKKLPQAPYPPITLHARQSISRRKAYRFAVRQNIASAGHIAPIRTYRARQDISRSIRSISRRKAYRFAVRQNIAPVRTYRAPLGTYHARQDISRSEKKGRAGHKSIPFPDPFLMYEQSLIF